MILTGEGRARTGRQESPMSSKPRSSGVNSWAQPHSVHSRVPGLAATSSACSTSRSGTPCGASSQSRRVQHTPGRAPTLAHLRRHPPRRPVLPEHLTDHRLRRRRKVLGGVLVVVDAVDRPHMVGSPDPHPILRRLHAAVLQVPVRRQPHEVQPTRLGLPLPPQPRHDLLLRVSEQRVGGQHDAHRHRLAASSEAVLTAPR